MVHLCDRLVSDDFEPNSSRCSICGDKATSARIELLIFLPTDKLPAIDLMMRQTRFSSKSVCSTTMRMNFGIFRDQISKTWLTSILSSWRNPFSLCKYRSKMAASSGSLKILLPAFVKASNVSLDEHLGDR